MVSTVDAIVKEHFQDKLERNEAEGREMLEHCWDQYHLTPNKEYMDKAISLLSSKPEEVLEFGYQKVGHFQAYLTGGYILKRAQEFGWKLDGKKILERGYQSVSNLGHLALKLIEEELGIKADAQKIADEGYDAFGHYSAPALDALCYAYEKGFHVDLSRLDKKVVTETVTWLVGTYLRGGNTEDHGKEAKRVLITFRKMGWDLAQDSTIALLPGDGVYINRKVKGKRSLVSRGRSLAEKWLGI